MNRLLLATRSGHKVAEIRRILSVVPGLVVLDPDDAGLPYLPEEDALEPHDTFEQNALSKARYFNVRSGLPAVADDSGLEVHALNGAPGVRSKRFAPDTLVQGRALDDANNRHLLQLLERVGEGEREQGRGARYVCTVVMVDGKGPPLVCRGVVAGVILHAGRGSGGFGYDPLFQVPETGKTFAEMTMDEKNAISHRGRAFRALATALADRG